jgi:AAA15 family ATPase/GTPase
MMHHSLFIRPETASVFTLHNQERIDLRDDRFSSDVVVKTRVQTRVYTREIEIERG